MAGSWRMQNHKGQVPFMRHVPDIVCLQKGMLDSSIKDGYSFIKMLNTDGKMGDSLKQMVNTVVQI